MCDVYLAKTALRTYFIVPTAHPHRESIEALLIEDGCVFDNSWVTLQPKPHQQGNGFRTIGVDKTKQVLYDANYEIGDLARLIRKARRARWTSET